MLTAELGCFAHVVTPPCHYLVGDLLQDMETIYP